MGIFANLREWNTNRKEAKELEDIETKASALTEVGYTLRDAEPTVLLEEYVNRKININDKLIKLEENFRKADDNIEKYEKIQKKCEKELKDLKQKHPFLLGWPGALISKALQIGAGVGVAVALPFIPALAGLPVAALLGAQIAIPALATGTAIAGKEPLKSVVKALGGLTSKDRKDDMAKFKSNEDQIKRAKNNIALLRKQKQKYLAQIKENERKEIEANNDFKIIKSAIKDKYDKNKQSIACLKYYKENEEDMKEIATQAGLSMNIFNRIETARENLLNGENEPFEEVSTNQFLKDLKKFRKNLMLYRAEKIELKELEESIPDSLKAEDEVTAHEEEPRMDSSTPKDKEWEKINFRDTVRSVEESDRIDYKDLDKEVVDRMSKTAVMPLSSDQYLAMLGAISEGVSQNLAIKGVILEGNEMFTDEELIEYANKGAQALSETLSGERKGIDGEEPIGKIELENFVEKYKVVQKDIAEEKEKAEEEKLTKGEDTDLDIPA